MSNSSDKHNPLPSTTGVQSDRSAVGTVDNGTVDADSSSSVQHPAAGQGPIHPQTCCPNCRTIFEVSSEHLASSDTRVRCGECLSIFDALSNLQSDELLDGHNELLIDEEGNILDADDSCEGPMMDGPDNAIATTGDDTLAIGNVDQPRAPAGGQGDATALDVTYSDYDLFSGEAGLPDVAYFDQTQDIDSLRFDEPDGDETFSDTLFVHDMTVAESTEHDEQFGTQLPELEPNTADAKVDIVADDEQHEPVVFTYREPQEPSPELRGIEHTGAQAGAEPAFDGGSVAPAEQSGSSPWLMRAFLAMLIVMLTAGLYGYRSRDALLQNTDLRPWLERGCAWVGCELSPVVNLDALKVLKRAVFTHPTIDNALVIDLAFVNEAALDQPYPVLEIRLTNSNGGLVVQNNVEPADYLDDWQEDDLLATGERLDLSLTVEDPGQTATSFELQFQ